MSFIGKNIKKIRTVRKLSQAAFADLFNLARPSVGAYEEGRSEPKIDTIIAIAQHFGISTDALLRKELSVNELYSFDILKGEFDPTQMPPALGKSIKSAQKAAAEGKYNAGLPLVERETILEYIVNHQNKDFIVNLKTIQLPVDTSGILRAFEHTGDEMFYHERGIRDGDILLGKKIEAFPKKIKNAPVFILITSKGSIIRRLINVEDTLLHLKADNTAYENKVVDTGEVLEMWQVLGVWSNYIAPPSMVESRLMVVENQINQLNAKLLKLEGK